jgi:hypothetical protein
MARSPSKPPPLPSPGSTGGGRGVGAASAAASVRAGAALAAALAAVPVASRRRGGATAVYSSRPVRHYIVYVDRAGAAAEAAPTTWRSVQHLA